MGYSITPIINRSNRKNKSGKYRIQLRVTINRKSRYFSLDERIEKNYWSGRTGRWVKESHPFAFELNSLIRKKLEAVDGFIYRQKLFGNLLSLESVMAHLAKKSDSNTFNSYVKVYLRENKFGSLNTVKKYRTFDRYIDEFNPGIPFSALNESLFQGFAQFLLAKGQLGVTVFKYFDPFKKICKRAVKEGYLEKDPFYQVDLGVKPTKSKRAYLEVEEVVQLTQAQIPKERPDLEDTRQHWLFCFYAAFYYSDLKKLQWEEIKSGDLGYVIVSERFKNGESFIAPIFKFPLACTIINEQRGKDPEFVFPGVISEQKFNSKLKELALLVGLDKNLTNKMARHSAIQFWEAKGLETQHTAKIAGHTSEKTTKNYYDLSIRDISLRVANIDCEKLGQ